MLRPQSMYSSIHLLSWSKATPKLPFLLLLSPISYLFAPQVVKRTTSETVFSLTWNSVFGFLVCVWFGVRVVGNIADQHRVRGFCDATVVVVSLKK